MKLCPLLAALFAVSLFSAGDARAQCAVGNILFENDILGGGTDRHYTHGSRFSCMSDTTGVDHPARRTANALQFELFGTPILDTGGEVRYSLAFGQSMFTPEDLARYDVVTEDRPYAGWLFGTMGLVLGPSRDRTSASAAFDRLETLEFTLGIVGPASGAEHTQKFVHTTIDAPYPEGWHNQLHNEPGFILAYEHKWRSEAWSVLPGSDLLKVDMMPSAGFALGNIHTYGSAALTFRFGSRLANDFGPPRIRPSVSGSEYYDPDPDESFGAYLFVSLGGRVVGRNIFLDGNSFTDSHHVDKEIFVGDLQFGAVFSLGGRSRVALTHIIRSPEFEGQDRANQFSAISVSFAF